MLGRPFLLFLLPILFLFLFFQGGCASSNIEEIVWINSENPKKGKRASFLNRKRQHHLLRRQKNSSRRIVFLARISTSYNKKAYDLLILVNSKNRIVGIQTRAQHKKKIKTYPASKFKKKIPLMKTAGITLMSLECFNFNPRTGCKLRIRYPYNFTYASFRYFDSFLRQEKGLWGLYAHQGRPFTHIRLVAKKWLGALVGVENIELAFRRIPMAYGGNK